MKRFIGCIVLVFAVTALDIMLDKVQLASAMAQQRKTRTVSRPTLPTDDESTNMANGSVRSLAEALRRNDFSEFYQSASVRLQREMSLEKLREVFKPLLEQKIDLTSVRSANPVFTEKPKVDESGELELKGYYPAKLKQISFTLNYVQEEGHWKLSGIYITPEGLLLSSEKAEMPRQGELIAITNNSMLVLATAVRNDDFSCLYRYIAEFWQRQTTREKLKMQFSKFLQKRISLDPIAGVEPVFDKEPGFDSNGVLTVIGHYATESYRIDFRLKFLSEKQTWKLVGISMEVNGE